MEKSKQSNSRPYFEPQIRVYSPGRINLIGEHTDYNDGFVLPSAISRAVTMEMRKNGDPHICSIHSKTLNSSFTFDLRKISRSDISWENFILGVVAEIQRTGRDLAGFDCLIDSDLPTGAGVSSSAALECGVAFGLNELFGLGLDRRAIATLSRDAEHNYVGTRCGIMDQFASVLSKDGDLMLLDCRSLEIDYIEADLTGYSILLLNTGVSHNLAGSEYNKRREECEAAVQSLTQVFPEVQSLRDVDLAMLEEHKEALTKVQYDRAHYVIGENHRVLQAVSAIREGRIDAFGDLMYQSHYGLQHEYEVSCPELDFLVECARNSGLVTGSRMMGGGFGGCTINLIAENGLTEFKELAASAYKKRFGITPEAIAVTLSGGTSLIK